MQRIVTLLCPRGSHSLRGTQTPRQRNNHKRGKRCVGRRKCSSRHRKEVILSENIQGDFPEKVSLSPVIKMTEVAKILPLGESARV